MSLMSTSVQGQNGERLLRLLLIVGDLIPIESWTGPYRISA